MSLQKLFVAAALVPVLGLAALSQAAIVVNGGFETADSSPADAASWTNENGSTIVRLPTGGVGGSAGLLISNFGPNPGSVGPLRQNTFDAGGDAVVGGQEYTFSFDNQRTFTDGGVLFVQLVAFNSGGGAVGFPVDGGLGTLASPTVGFVNNSFTFIAPADATRFEINFRANTGGAATSTASIIVDNVSITSAVVPEPTALAALGLGGLAMLRRRRA